MENAKRIAAEYLRRLDAGEIKLERPPNHGDQPADETPEKDLQRYREFLRSDFFRAVVSDCLADFCLFEVKQ